MKYESQRRETSDLHDVQDKLRALYDPANQKHMYERLLPKLGSLSQALVQHKLNRIVWEETGDETITYEDLNEQDRTALSMFLDPQVRKIHLESGRDYALSNHTHSIAHFDTQPPIVADELIKVVLSENPDSLEQMGSVFFDVDGTKTLVDCTSHAHAGKYLEALAEFFCNLPEPVQKWLKERHLRTEAYSVAGDEYVMIIRASDGVLTKELLDEVGKKVQEAIANDAHLTAFISFDDPDFVMEYDEWTDEDRKAYEENPTSMQERYIESRKKLPDEGFKPSVSSGSATLLEAVREALSPDTEEAQNLEELGINAFHLMVARADARLKEDKRVFRANLADPKWKAFLLRNGENRRLLAELEETQMKNLQFEAEVQVQRARMQELMQHEIQLLTELEQTQIRNTQLESEILTQLLRIQELMERDVRFSRPEKD